MKEIVTKTIKNFEPLKHRMQKVFSYNDIDVIDDSKATNPDSTICALLSIKKPIILLLQTTAVLKQRFHLITACLRQIPLTFLVQ